MGAIDDGSATYIINKVLNGMKTNQVTGVPPQNMPTLTLSPGDSKIRIRGSVPDNTVIENQLLCTVGGVRIMRKTASAPISPEDGTLVADLKAGTSIDITDTGLANGVTYFYAAFPYSDHGVFNYNAENVRSATPSAIKYWAFDQDFSNGDPAATISYPSDFQNSNFKQMLTNEGTGTVTAGDWGPFLEETLKNYPAMVTPDGKMYKQLNPDDYTRYLDGSAAPYNAATYYAGAWINKLYTHEEYGNNGDSREVIFADGEVSDFTPMGFVDMDLEEINGVWIPMAYINASGQTIISGSTPVASKTADQEKALITGFSSRGVFLGGAILNLLRDIEYMIFKSTDIQKQAGHGRCNAGSQQVIANAVVANGAVRGWKGTASASKALNKYFHSQVLGSYQQWIRDPYTQEISGVLYVDPYYRYNIGTAQKVNTGINMGNSAAWYYPKHLQKVSDAFGSVPKTENTGSTSTGLCDGLYTNSSGTRVALRLGHCDGDLIGGPADLRLNHEASYASWHFGVGLMLLPPAGYTPDLEEVE